MSVISFARRVRGLVALSAALSVCGSLGSSLDPSPARAAGSETWPSRVRAHYKISFNGIDIGSFRFETGIGPDGYTADGKAELSALLGALQWQGITRVSGAIDSAAPHPAGYTFAFRSSSKTGSVKLAFAKGNITDVSMVPPPDDADDIVPVKPHHLHNVLDPLSAVLAMARPASGDPCGRKLPIFDGKQRFDLVMSFRREVAVPVARSSGQPGVAIVCGVRYVPIAGYKASEETKRLAAQTGIEVALRPVPSANIYIPQEITIPTGFGAAVISAQRVEIDTAASGQIALIDY